MLFDVAPNQQALAIELVEELSSQLLSRGQKIATVESCTGGAVAALLTDFAGSSAWFDRGFVTYSNQSKVEMVGVQQASISRFGAVSVQLADEMAKGGVAKSDAACALSITGIAGPQGGSKEKPVGTVCFGWAGFKNEVVTEKQHFSGGRASIRFQSICHALKVASSLFED